MGNILWVDDNAHQLESLIHPLKLNGHEIITASNAEEASNILRKKKFDLIILDLILPRIRKGSRFIEHRDYKDLEGIRFAEQMYRNRNEIPIVVFSVFSINEKFIGRLKKIGVKEVLLKTSPKLLIETCNAMLA